MLLAPLHHPSGSRGSGPSRRGSPGPVCARRGRAQLRQPVCRPTPAPLFCPYEGVNPAMGVRGQQPPPETIAPSVDSMRSLPQPRSQAKCWLFPSTGLALTTSSQRRQDSWQDSVYSYPGQRCLQLAGAPSAVSWVTGIAADGHNGTLLASGLPQMLLKVLHPSLVLAPQSRIF